MASASFIFLRESIFLDLRLVLMLSSRKFEESVFHPPLTD